VNGELRFLNRQRNRRVNLRLLRKITLELIKLSGAREFDLVIHLVSASEMEHLNEFHMGHSGSTDVITLDYLDGNPETPTGEIIVCVEEAVAQAASFRTSWQSELMRYVVHSVLHLQGHDDLTAAQRRKMKREEDRIVLELERRFDLRKLGPTPRLAG